ncbi:uncharacterized protein FMAN_00233 [Fusarium mangiferae]|uniref:Uncharacterized protein n=1 Tax=Fusarium mangiferae TaxID=192010 RepID=A0A1L7U5F9_FUSMA|nr:uncharacterized protein FMAN_00233 [Fusarium mangiferae]CVL02751.1 uncharacterized protein FMAN_00233 [Fusarium mangiferae]
MSAKYKSISTRDLLAFCSPNLRPPSLTSDAIITDTSPSFQLAISTPHRQDALPRRRPYHDLSGHQARFPDHPRPHVLALPLPRGRLQQHPLQPSKQVVRPRILDLHGHRLLRSLRHCCLPDLQAPVNYSPTDCICCCVERLGSLEVECGVNIRNRHQSFSTLDSKFHLFDYQLYRTIRESAIMTIASYAIPSQPDLCIQNSRAPGYYSKLRYMVVQNLLLHHNLVPSFLYLRYDGPSH